MSDNLKEVGKEDRDRINVNEAHEVQYWTKELGVNTQQLIAAVKAAGVMAADVREYLKDKS